MQTTVEETEKHTVKLTIEVPPDEFQRDLDQTYRAIADEIKIPGFRKGKAPKPIIDAQVGRDVVLEEFVSSTVPTYFRAAVSEEDLAPIGNPDVDVEQMELGKPFIFTATVEVRPRLELTEDDYKGVEVTRPAVEVTDDEVDAWQERLRRQFAELEPVTRPVQESDFVTVNVKVTKDGQELESLTREDYLYSVGSGELGEAMDQQLPGKKPGDILDFDGTLPPSLPEDLAGAGAHFTVLVKDVKALKLPEADHDFATTASEFDTLDELRADLREKIHEAKERESEGVIRDRALQAMIDRVDVELPDSLIDDETSHRMQHAEERAARYGVSLDQMLELQGWDRDRLAEDSRDHAVRGIKADLVLEGIARSESIEITAEEIGAEIGSLAQAYDRDPKELATQLDQSGQIVTLAGDIIRSKALDILVEHAEISDEAPAAEEEANIEGDEASEITNDDSPEAADDTEDAAAEATEETA
ncbi:MAG: trigger factor [Actinomycetota bacterium]